MNVLTRYAFVSNFNAEKISKQEATTNGVGSNTFLQCDTDGDGNLTIDEILANTESCDVIMRAIQAKIDKITQEENVIKSEQTKDGVKGEKFDWATA